jgi:hypothetical protein
MSFGCRVAFVVASQKFNDRDCRYLVCHKFILCMTGLVLVAFVKTLSFCAYQISIAINYSIEPRKLFGYLTSVGSRGMRNMPP